LETFLINFKLNFLIEKDVRDKNKEALNENGRNILTFPNAIS